LQQFKKHNYALKAIIALEAELLVRFVPSASTVRWAQTFRFPATQDSLALVKGSMFRSPHVWLETTAVRLPITLSSLHCVSMKLPLPALKVQPVLLAQPALQEVTVLQIVLDLTLVQLELTSPTLVNH
jgi:hypothetical protein